MHREAVEYIPRHTTLMTQNIFNGGIFRVLQIRKHEIISQQSRHWCRPLRIRGICHSRAGGVQRLQPAAVKDFAVLAQSKSMSAVALSSRIRASHSSMLGE